MKKMNDRQMKEFVSRLDKTKLIKGKKGKKNKYADFLRVASSQKGSL